MKNSVQPNKRSELEPQAPGSPDELQNDHKKAKLEQDSPTKKALAIEEFKSVDGSSSEKNHISTTTNLEPVSPIQEDSEATKLNYKLTDISNEKTSVSEPQQAGEKSSQSSHSQFGLNSNYTIEGFGLSGRTLEPKDSIKKTLDRQTEEEFKKQFEKPRALFGQGTSLGVGSTSKPFGSLSANTGSVFKKEAKKDNDLSESSFSASDLMAQFKAKSKSHNSVSTFAKLASGMSDAKCDLEKNSKSSFQIVENIATGEEEEINKGEWKGILYEMGNDNQYFLRGKGTLKLNQNASNKKAKRLIMRAAKVGNVLLNVGLYKELRPFVVEKSLRFSVPVSGSKPKSYAIKVNTEVEAEKIVKRINDVLDEP